IKKPERHSKAISCLDRFVSVAGLGSIISQITKELLTWLSDHLKNEKNNFNKQSLVSSVLSCLKDHDRNIKEAAKSCLDNLVSIAGLGCIIVPLTKEQDPLLKKELLIWLSDRLNNEKTNLPKIQLLISYILSCLKDRNGIREVARSCLNSLVLDIGLARIIPSLSKNLNSDDSLLRKEILVWLSDRLKDEDKKNNLKNTLPTISPLFISKKPDLNSVKNRKRCEGKKMENFSIMPTIKVVSKDNNVCDDKISKLSHASVFKPSVSFTQNTGSYTMRSLAKRSTVPPSKVCTNNGQTITSSSNKSGKKKSTGKRIDTSKYPIPTNFEHIKATNSYGISPKEQSTYEHDSELLKIIISKISDVEQQQKIKGFIELKKFLINSHESIIPHVDMLINVLIDQMQLSYKQFKPLCSNLILLFSEERQSLAFAISQELLEQLLSKLAHCLNQCLKADLEAEKQSSKYLEYSMLKILINSNRITIYSTIGNNKQVFVQKNLKDGILLPNKLLQDLNNFFIPTSPTENIDKTSLYIIKFLISELVKSFGRKIFEHLDLIDDPFRSHVFPLLLDAYCEKEKQHANYKILVSGNSSNCSYSNFQTKNYLFSQTSAKSPIIFKVPAQINEVQCTSSESVSSTSLPNQDYSSESYEMDVNTFSQSLYELYEPMKHYLDSRKHDIERSKQNLENVLANFNCLKRS
ncbi:8150_t:CDS:2, partial [Dentiscutata erythropus]